MPIALRQTAGNAISASQGSTCTVSLSTPTAAGSLIVVWALANHSSYGYYPLYGPAGFTLAMAQTEDETTLAVWYRAASPAMTQISVLSSASKALLVRVQEYTGAAQTAVLDKISFEGDNDENGGNGSDDPHSGSTGTTSQADELVVGAIGNRYSSTTQYGFTGGLTKLSEHTTPSSDDDSRRLRLSVHQAFQSVAGSWSLGGRLSTVRDWIAVILTFKGGTIGPARMTSLNQAPMLTTGGGGDLTVFGPLKSVTATESMITVAGAGRIGPFENQLRLGGWDGLLIGASTPYRIESIEGLGGWDMRVSDLEFPRGDGAQRGVDLQSARQILIKTNFHDLDPVVMEQLTVDLYNALVPQRDTDWELLFRLVGQPLQQISVRPITLNRLIDRDQMIRRDQSIALRAADPRIYSSRELVANVDVTPAGQGTVLTTSVVNEGNGRAYPVIRITNHASYTVTAARVVNATADCAFEILGSIAPGAQVVGDMPARVTQAPRSVVTMQGQSVYGAWQPPREPFFLAPDPEVPAGVNAIYLTTTPPGAPVVASLEYRDTWAG